MRDGKQLPHQDGATGTGPGWRDGDRSELTGRSTAPHRRTGPCGTSSPASPTARTTADRLPGGVDSRNARENSNPSPSRLFPRLRKAGLEPIDIIAVVRHNKTLEMGNYRKAAEEGNFFLRGFNYLFIMKKP